MPVHLNIVLDCYLVWLLAVNVLTAYVYAHDKWAARHRKWRTRERTLFLLNLAGGVVGAWLVFFGLHHKTRHLSFWVVQALCTLLHMGILVWLAQLPG